MLRSTIYFDRERESGEDLLICSARELVFGFNAEKKRRMSREEDQMEILTCFGYCSFANEKKNNKTEKSTTDETKKERISFADRQTDKRQQQENSRSLMNDVS